ncbi:MAG: LicD family protein, partial [Eggerthellales bacterium]|nr:LicD family protein [Eggerthellales bacterium]
TDDEVKQCQLRMLDIMDEFCAAHDLTYWIAYGSLIGAVRHKGYIPWDDDLDLAMPLSHYQRFLELAATEEGRAFFAERSIRVADDSVDPDIPYHQTFAKLYDIRTQASRGVLEYDREGFVECVFVDLFPIVGLTGTGDEDARLLQLDRLYNKVRYASEVFSATAYKEGKKRFLKRLVGYLPARAKGYRHWLRAFCQLRNTFPDALDCEVWTVPDSDPARYRMGRNVKTVRLPFEGRMVPAPEDYDTFLRGYYGDYMQLPPEDQRVPSHSQGFWWIDDAR